VRGQGLHGGRRGQLWRTWGSTRGGEGPRVLNASERAQREGRVSAWERIGRGAGGKKLTELGVESVECEGCGGRKAIPEYELKGGRVGVNVPN